MNMNYLLEMIDYLIEFIKLLEIATVNDYDATRLVEHLMYFRKHGKISQEYMPGDIKPIFHLLLHELKAQIEEADPDWFEAYIVKREDREHEARVVDAFLAEQARIEEEEAQAPAEEVLGANA